MKRLIVVVLVTLLAVPAFAGDPPKTEEERTLYAVGLIVAQQLSPFNFTPMELEVVKQGISDALTGQKPYVEIDAYSQKVQALANARRNALGEKLAVEAKAFIEKALQEKGAIKSASGLVYLPRKEGTGSSPAATDRVEVNYSGTLVDGVVFDSSSKRGQPLDVALNSVIKCWTEGLQMMKPGGQARLVCPPEIAYGERGSGLIPPNATLVFDVELLEVKK